jgi:predicted NBD/HSP70 family sugar kinase
VPPLEVNAQHVFALIAASDGITRAELITRARVSRPTVLDAVRYLLDRGRVVQTMAPPGASGRTPGILSVAPPSGHVVGFDVGQEHVHIKVVEIGSGALVVNISGSLEEEKGPVALNVIAKLLAAGLDDKSIDPRTIRAIGIGLPFAVLPGGQVVEASVPLWAGVNVRHALVKALDDATQYTDWNGDDVYVARDADMGALGEAPLPERRDWPSFLYAKVSTGIAGSLFTRGGEQAIVDTYRSVDLGHVGVSAAAEERLRDIYLPPTMPVRCTVCGQYDCLETRASVRALAEQLGLGTDSVKTIETIVGRLADDTAERRTREAVSAAGWRIGFGLAAAMRTCDVRRVLIGGLIVHAERYVREPILQAINQVLAGWTGVEVAFVESGRIYDSEVDGAVNLAVQQAAMSYDDNLVANHDSVDAGDDEDADAGPTATSAQASAAADSETAPEAVPV